MKKIVLLFLLIAIAICSIVFINGKKTSKVNAVVITVTNSNIAEIVSSISGSDIKVNTLLSPFICPSNNDITPNMIEMAENSDAILANSWDTWVNKLSKSVTYLKTSGNLMIPHIRVKAVKEILEILINTEKISIEVNKNYKDYIEDIKKLEKYSQEELLKYKGIKVICNDKIKDMLESFEFKVIATYGKKENLTVKQLAKLIETGKKENVLLVVDNLQAGSNTGNEIAKNINAKQVTISNFVLNNSYIETYKENILTIKKALK